MNYNLVFVQVFCKVSYFVVVSGIIEADPEYQLIVEANNITVEIDNEISKYHFSICNI